MTAPWASPEQDQLTNGCPGASQGVPPVKRQGNDSVFPNSLILWDTSTLPETLVTTRVWEHMLFFLWLVQGSSCPIHSDQGRFSVIQDSRAQGLGIGVARVPDPALHARIEVLPPQPPLSVATREAVAVVVAKAPAVAIHHVSQQVQTVAASRWGRQPLCAKTFWTLISSSLAPPKPRPRPPSHTSPRPPLLEFPSPAGNGSENPVKIAIFSPPRVTGSGRSR